MAGSSGAEHVLAVLPRGEAIRTHVYSNVLDRVQEAVRLSVASVIPTPEIEQLLTERYGPIHPVIDDPSRWPVRAVREVLEVSHGQYLRSEAAKERFRRRAVEATTTAATLKRVAKRAIALPLSRPGVLSALDGVHEHGLYRFRTVEEPKRLIERLAPTLVFNGSHVHSRNAEPMVAAARAAGIPAATFLFSWDNLTSQGRIAPRYDRFIAWSESIRDDLLRIYPRTDPESVVVTGTPQFDFHYWPDLHWSRERYCEEIGADPERPIVVYSTGMPNHMPAEPEIVEHLADELTAMTDLGSPQLVVRLYAKDRTDRFADLQRRRGDILFPAVAWAQEWLTPLPEDTVLWTNMLLHADLGVNVASTVSLELCMFDKPVLNVGYNPASVPRSEIDYARYYSFDHYRPVVESGAVQVVSSPGELAEAVRQSLRHPSEHSADRKALLDQMFGGTLDGRAGQRVADAVVRFAREAGR